MVAAARKNTRRSRAQGTAGKPKPAVKTPATSAEPAALEPSVRRPIPSAWRLSRLAVTNLGLRPWVFVGIVAWYGLLNAVLVRGLSSGIDVASLRAELGGSKLTGGAATFTQLVGSVGSGSTAAASAYQLFLFLVVSLALIWALRQTQAGAVIRIRDAFYRGMYPLIQFGLTLLVIALQFIPLLIGITLYELVAVNGIAANGLETAIWGTLAILLALVSFYFVTPSVIALYIVTLPDMTPLPALRSARELVRHRRFGVLRKMLFLPLALLVVLFIVTLPFIVLTPAIAVWIFFILSLLALAFAHSYLYSLYRGLLND